MTAGLILSIKSNPPFRDTKGRYVKAEKALVHAMRKDVTAQGRRLRELAQEEAPKRSGKFASGIRSRTFVRPNSVEVRITAPEPLSTFIIQGTRPHIIRPKRAKFLRFYWPKVGRVVYLKKVNHPGTKPNRFIGRAYRRWLPGARGMLRRIGNSFERELKR